jgi:tryptophan synthase alpha chain
MTLQELFKNKDHDLLNIYFSAGFPHIDSMAEILDSLEKSGADMVEIGIPYSDPLSDGPTIQKSNSIALKNGISLELIFQQLENSSSSLPKIMMGYYNSVLQFGMKKFCARCAQTGVSGVILPDLPIEIWEQQYKSLFEEFGLSAIFLITPETSEERIRMIDQKTTSFIYAVSSAGTTGTKKGIFGAEDYLKRIQSLQLTNPVLVGFNIGSPEDFQFANKFANGGIIGSAFINHIKESTDLTKDINNFIHYIKS